MRRTASRRAVLGTLAVGLLLSGTATFAHDREDNYYGRDGDEEQTLLVWAGDVPLFPATPPDHLWHLARIWHGELAIPESGSGRPITWRLGGLEPAT